MKNINKNLSFPNLPVRRGLGNFPLSESLLKGEKQPNLIKKVEDPRQKHSGMTLCFMGFTLIELLVVVLIIGILAAVALPQYTLAVNKSRFANLRSMAQPYVKAMEAYHLANGEWPSSFDELSVDAPAGMTVTTHTNPPAQCAHNNDTYCCVQYQSGSWSTTAYCGRLDYSFMYLYPLIFTPNPNINEQDLCVAKKNNPQAVKLCKSFGGSVVLTGNMWSPEGIKSGYDYYSMNM